MLKNKIFIVFILVTFLIPEMDISSKIPALKIADIFYIFLLMLILLEDKIHNRQLIFNNELLPIFIFLLISAIISICLPTIIYNTDLIYRDFMIIPQIIKYFIIFSISQSLIINIKEYKNIIKTIFLCAFLASFISIFQYFNFLNINEWLTPVYRGNSDAFSHYVDNIYIQGRISGIDANSNFFGYKMATLLCFLVVYFFSIKKVMYKFIFFVIVILSGISVILTISRTAIISFFFVVIAVTFLYYHISRKFKTVLIVIILFLGFIVIFPNFISRSYIDRIDISGNSTQTSANARIRDLKKPFEINFSSVIYTVIGEGPSKEHLREDSHSDIGWFFQRFGLIGLFLYLLMISKLLIRSFSNYLSHPMIWKREMNLSCFLVFCNYLLFGFSANMFKMVNITTLTLLIGSIAFAQTYDGKLDTLPSE